MHCLPRSCSYSPGYNHGLVELPDLDPVVFLVVLHKGQAGPIGGGEGGLRVHIEVDVVHTVVLVIVPAQVTRKYLM